MKFYGTSADFYKDLENQSRSELTSFDSSEYDDLFKDTEYWDLYQAIIRQYANAPKGSVWGAFTGQNERDIYNHNQSRSDAINALLETMRSEKHNSTASQVARDKEAGLNPDLLGVSDAGQSKGSNIPVNPGLQPDSSFQNIVSFLGTISTAVSASQSMISQSLVNDAQRLDNLSTINDISLSTIGKTGIDYDPNYEIMPAISFGYRTGNKRLDNKLEKSSRSWMGTVASRASIKSNEKTLAQTRKELHDIQSSAGYSDDDDIYSKVAQRVAPLYQMLLESDMYKNISKNYSDKKYFDNFDAGLKAEVDNSSNRKSKYQVDFWKKAFGIERGVIKLLRDESSKGNAQATDLLFRLFGIQSDYPSGSWLNTIQYDAIAPFKK